LSVRPSDNKKKKQRENIKNTYDDENKYLVYKLLGLALAHHSMHATY